MNKDLLRVLADKTGCVYLSDLRFKICQNDMTSVIKSLNAADFSLKEWNNAANYLTGNTSKFSNEKEAKEYILNSILTD